MATRAQNNLSRVVGARKTLSYPILSDGTADINQGDLVYFDSTAHAVKPIDTDAHAANIAGCAAKSSFLALYTNAGVASKVYEPEMEVGFGDVYFFNTTLGDTYNHLDAVFIGADAQTVTKAAGTHAVGYVILENGQSPVVGGTGIIVRILVVAQVPVVIG